MSTRSTARSTATGSVKGGGGLQEDEDLRGTDVGTDAGADAGTERLQGVQEGGLRRGLVLGEFDRPADHTGAGRDRLGRDGVAVGADDDRVDRPGGPGDRDRPRDERPAGDLAEVLAGDALRSRPCRDHRDDAGGGAHARKRRERW
ncbi:hypothetical protein DEJ15_07125 [Curtobacterium sp. MCJR17_043]|nr:hypothetical protein [Curtobacterium sp. MCJR17_043]WIB36784.1 hypothetical protein DEJ15_07125 [Curtobacterium sp. MCJR17_043]